MTKINGYTEEEAKRLVRFVEEGKNKGKTLTSLFAEYGVKNGRAKGSVRNYYYALMKNERGDERIVKMLDGTTLSVGKIRAFTDEEADAALRSILQERAKGLSVRRAIFNLSGGDDKLMLRLQNKYRNTLKKEPEKLRALQEELGCEPIPALQKRVDEGGRVLTKQTKNGMPALKEEARTLLQKRLEKEIDALYDRLTQALKEENTRLREENLALKSELANVKND
ncbi:MAG: hypothetical protein IJX81_03405 [Clostridia bacterium]|nr:hypothetical protein [Clostridia bacterium]